MSIKKPEMILFDYGQTIVDEEEFGFNGVKGTAAVLQYAVRNKYSRSAEEVQAYAECLNQELGRFDPERRHLCQVEIPNHMFTKYLYESLGIELSIGPEEIDRVFWDAAAPGRPTEGIEDFLLFLKQNHVRTGVISNISYSGKVVAERITGCIPDHSFEFILATSEYLFRKPNRRIFELALEKAGLEAEAVWYIGDQYQCDIVGAANAGLFPVWYLGATKKREEPAAEILIIHHWGELQTLLQTL